MSLRLRFFNSPSRAFRVLAWGLLFAGKAFAMEVTYAPPVVFSGEPLAFRLQSAAPVTVTVLTNGVRTARLALGERRPAEHTFRPAQDLKLSFTTGDSERIFHIIRPESAPVLTERDGYLESGGQPVVLLPEHRKPPPLDRRWETLELLRRHVQDPRPRLEALLWICPDRPEPDLRLAVKLSTRPPERLLVSEREAWFYVHGLLIRPELPQSRFLVLEVDERDLERGMPPHEWFMKWQFALQKLEADIGYEDGLLLGPPESPVSAPWLPLLREELQNLARAHRLHFVDRSRTEALWTERLLNRLSRDYLLP